MTGDGKTAAGLAALEKAEGVSGSDRPGGAIDPRMPPAAGAQTAAVPPTVASTLGEMVWLLTMSPLHRHLFLSDLEWTVMPAILLGQYKLFRAEGRTAGVALWAYLNEEAEARLLAGQTRLKPEDWKGGTRPWLIDVIAPFGGTEAMLEDLKKTALAGKNAKYHRRGKDGKVEVGELG